MNIDQEHLGPPMRVDPPQTRGARSCNFVLLQFFRRKTYDLSVYMNRSTLFQSPCPSILTTPFLVLEIANKDILRSLKS